MNSSFSSSFSSSIRLNERAASMSSSKSSNGLSCKVSSFMFAFAGNNRCFEYAFEYAPPHPRTPAFNRSNTV